MTTATVPMADCPRCDMGFDGCDEEGRPYACYFCGCTGLITLAAAQEEARERAWCGYVALERSIRQRASLGVPAGFTYYFDGHDGELVLVPPPELRQPVAASLYDDDIPF